jgi:hypothetical protein
VYMHISPNKHPVGELQFTNTNKFKIIIMKKIWVILSVFVDILISYIICYENITETAVQRVLLEKDCGFSSLSPAIHSILCAVESEDWTFPKELSTFQYLGCLIDDNHPKRWNRCIAPLNIPTPNETPKSPPPPAAKMIEYQKLAMIAENLVPKTWWREGYASPALLLSHNATQLPKRLLNTGLIRNKKLKNIVLCVTRQVFIRDSYSFSVSSEGSKCSSAKPVSSFFAAWQRDKQSLAGSFKQSNGHDIWQPSSADNGNLLVLAIEAFDYFVSNYGGIWKGCFGLKEDGYCRGGLAAASMVISANYIYDIVTKVKASSVSNLIAGYMYASLGRGLLHGEKKSTGNTPITAWGVTLNDFIALQAAYQKLYIDSVGKEYARQLDYYIPIAFPPSFGVYSKRIWKDVARRGLEPVYSSLRNLMFTEAQVLIDFGPYRPLVAFQGVRNVVASKRRILIDVGANGFFASPKYLLDSYAPYMPFTHAIMVEPEPHFSASIPPAYSERYNISFHQVYAEVGTGSATDMLKMLPTMVTKNDFVVLKFDVDPNQ